MGGKHSKSRQRDCSSGVGLQSGAVDGTAVKKDEFLALPDPTSPRLVLLLSKSAGKDADLLQRRRRFLQAALWDALESTGLFMERVAPGGSLEGCEAWVLGFAPDAVKKAAEVQGLPKRRRFHFRTPEGHIRSFIRWRPYRIVPSVEDGEEADGTETHFATSEVLSLLYTCAFRAVLPCVRKLDAEDEEFAALELLCARHSVLALALHGGAISQVTAMHDPVKKSEIWQLWPSLTRGLSQLPMEHVVTYFGLHTAEYFAFLQEYSCWLSVPALAGVVVQLVHMFSDSADQPISSTRMSRGFMIFMGVWSTVFVEHWKRCRAVLKYEHGACEVNTEGEADCEAPAAYTVRADRLSNAFSASPRPAASLGPSSSGQQHGDKSSLGAAMPLFRFFRTVVAMCCLASSVGFIIWGLLRVGEIAEKESDNILVQNLPVILYLIVVGVMEGLYNSGVEVLVRMESHLSYAEYLKSLTSKKLFFQLVNYLGWFLYVAFYMKDMEYLRSQLLMFMTVKQLVALAQETLIPLCLKRKLIRENPRSDEKKDPPEAPAVNRAQMNLSGSPSAPGLRRRKVGAPQDRRSASSVPRTEVMGSAALFHDHSALERDVGRQLRLDKTDLCAEYQQLVVLFALTNSFAIAFPLGPLLAFLHTMVTRQSDCYKFLLLNMRSAPSPADGVISDTWIDVLEALSLASVVCNVAVLAVSDVDSSWDPLALVILEHALLFFKAYLAWSVPDQPEWIRREDANFAELKRYNEMLVDEATAQSTRAS
eukprot:gb/GFBE01079992.1/.p1 GENE.gb/GFBE01079992.1/~~gb/GFBE01079992.1/.p1  ORF type:complete len:764 (+),score=146.39 gb/GFBE01079992.1/:1-2292(+)